MRKLGSLTLLASRTSVGRTFHRTQLLQGLEQIDDIPTSTTRVPKGKHRGPGKRQTSAKEAEMYRFMKKVELEMKEQWDTLEPFRTLPKPKKQFGNEAAEIIWPYTLLMEKVVKVHPFTKSVYVYYAQHQMSAIGKYSSAVAQRFSREFLIPITFHNNQTYVETEMLMECNDTPWIVVHCLDGRHKIIPVKISPALSKRVQEEHLPETDVVPLLAAEAANVLKTVVDVCEELGSSVANPKQCTRLLNDRPLQNQYVRVNYQWFGDTPEDRMTHLVNWDWEHDDINSIGTNIQNLTLDWLGYDGYTRENDPGMRMQKHRANQSVRKPMVAAGPRTFFNSGTRQHSTYSKITGKSAAQQ